MFASCVQCCPREERSRNYKATILTANFVESYAGILHPKPVPCKYVVPPPSYNVLGMLHEKKRLQQKTIQGIALATVHYVEQPHLEISRRQA